MIAYIDTSALLRLVLREPGALDELRSGDRLVSSEIIVVESLRAIDHLRLQGALSAEEAASRRQHTTELTLATHDKDLALAARSFGIDVLGT